MVSMSSGIWLDVASLGIIMVLFLIYQYRRDIPVRQNKLLLTMAKLTFFYTLSDFFCALLVEGTLPSFNWGYYIAKGCLFFTESATSLYYMLYVLEFLGIRYKKNTMIILGEIPMGIAIFMIVFAVLNQSPSLLEGITFRMLDIPIVTVYFINVYFAFVALFAILHHRKNLNFMTGVILFSYVFFAFLGPILQTFDPNIRISAFTLTISMLLMYLTIQNPEAIIDGTTGLLNRKAFTAISQNTIDSGRPFSVFILGIEDYVFYRSLLDSVSCGKMLNVQTDRLKEYEDISRIYRIAEDQFAFIISEGHSEDTDNLFRSMTMPFSEPFEANGLKISIRTYGSILHYPKHFDTTDMLFFLADQLRERSRSETEYGVRTFSITMLNQEEILRRQAISMLVKNVDPEKIKISFRPIQSVQERRYTSAHVELMLFTQTFGKIPPSEYLSLAEQSNTSYLFNEYLLDIACTIIGSGKLKMHGIASLEISLTIGQWLEVGLANKIKGLLESHHAEPSMLLLGITASAKNAAPETVIKTLLQLEEIGVGIVVEQYGTGFNDIAKEFVLPKAIVNIATSFLAPEKRRAGADIIISESIHLFNQFGYQSQMDGIRSKEEEELCIKMGCAYLSGPYYSQDLLFDAKKLEAFSV
jgi:predicted signal transduction protein with EAL and GGDEF domain